MLTSEWHLSRYSINDQDIHRVIITLLYVELVRCGVSGTGEQITSSVGSSKPIAGAVDLRTEQTGSLTISAR